MDTFGRLPTDVLQTINHLFILPLINIVDNQGYLSMVINYPYITASIDMYPPLVGYIYAEHKDIISIPESP